MESHVVGPSDAAFAEALDALANPTRLALLRQLRTPRPLRDIEVLLSDPSAPARPPRAISRQAVKEQLDRLVELGVVELRPSTEPRLGPLYLLNHQKLFAIAEEFRELARLRAAEEPRNLTMEAKPTAQRWTIKGPCLVLVKGLDEGRTFPLGATPAMHREWVIGRRRGADVSLDFDPFVSTEHALVSQDAGAYLVEDLLDSRNGTFLNFEPLPKGKRKALATGDLLGVGRSLLMFRR